MLAPALGGTATGKGGNFLVADDLQNPGVAESKAVRENVNRFFDQTLASRLADKARGDLMVVIQQRTHQAGRRRCTSPILASRYQPRLRAIWKEP